MNIVSLVKGVTTVSNITTMDNEITMKNVTLSMDAVESQTQKIEETFENDKLMRSNQGTQIGTLAGLWRHPK